MKRVSLILFVIVLLVAAGAPRPHQAEADTSDELLQLVVDSFGNLMRLESFTAESEQLYTATVEVLRVKLEFTYHAVITSEVIPGDHLLAHATWNITMTSNFEPEPMTVTMEMFIDGETIYARIGAASFAGNPGSGTIDPGWVNTDLLGDDASPAYNGMNEAAFFQLFGMNYMYSPGLVASVSELPPSEVDGQTMRVIEVLYTSLNLEAGDVMDSMVDVFNGSAMGAWTEDMTREMLTGGSGYTVGVWIGTEDQLPHMISDFIEIESSITYQAQKATISATMATGTEITSMNEALTLTPPSVD